MKRSGALVPAGWAAYNGIWIILLAIFGGSAIPLWLYGGAVALVEILATAIFLSWWRNHLSGMRRVFPSHGDIAIVAAVGVVLVCLGAPLGPWFYPPGITTLLWAIVLSGLDYQMRHRLVRE